MKNNKFKHELAFSRNVSGLFLNILSQNIFRRSKNISWTTTIRNQLKAGRIRRNLLKENQAIPPVAIFSTTSKCNLNCKGCYSKARKPDLKTELPIDRIEALFTEASECGTRVIILAGGEPLLREDVIRAASKNKEVLFPVFTNGTLISDSFIDRVCYNKNIIPVLSIEGDSFDTDERRGEGVYKRIENSSEKFRQNSIFYGLSITLTSDNFSRVMRPDFINKYYEQGCRLFFFVEYVPQSDEDMSKCLSTDQKGQLSKKLDNFRLIFSSTFLALPGDEEKFGGCLAAGRGFVHISSKGDLEPCPFAPFSDVNISNLGYKAALKSRFLSTIRENHSLLKESQGGCTLWENRSWVRARVSKDVSMPEQVTLKRQAV